MLKSDCMIKYDQTSQGLTMPPTAAAHTLPQDYRAAAELSQ